MWPRVPPGRIPHTKKEFESSDEQTHFSFVFSQSGMKTLRFGIMPEMHVWVVISNVGKVPLVIDFSTKFLPKISERLLHVKWEAEQPPEYLWCTKLPDDVYYQAHPLATCLALKLLEDQYHPAYIPDIVRKQLAQIHTPR